MDRTELQEKLRQPFDSNRWKEIVEGVFPNNVTYWAKERPLPADDDSVEAFVDKGTVRLKDGRNLALLEVRVGDGMNLPRTRVKLRNLVAKYIDQETHYGVLAVFDQGGEDYRLSFVAKESELVDGEFIAKETPAKRYTYLLGKNEACRTAAERLAALSQKEEATLDDVTDAFSVEKLNKEFYRAIQKHFYQLVGGKVDKRDFDGCMALPSKPIKADGNHQAYSEFAVRLIGRVIFCWFLKHKKCDKNRPLIPQKLLSLKAVEANGGYYHSILEKLFFQTLNKPMGERSEYAPKHAHLIPYLNGGLFDPHKDDFYEEGAMGESKYAPTLLIPDDWFLSLFQTLEMYNFTIDENTALDNEVSIDPEILGRIFENLLAEINPETGDSARKATGSFYTPRAIVDYMVEESLVQHLKTALNVDAASSRIRPQNQTLPEPLPAQAKKTRSAQPNEAGSIVYDLEQTLRSLFLDDGNSHGLDEPTRKAVVDAFRTIKVLDPACGSGAFPVGILQKMLCALRKVDEDNDLWLTAQFEQIQSMNLSRQEESRRLDEIEHAFKTNEADYGRKLGIIQNSVYGVDIQPIAIEIAKLRFFLTLVVDEKINEKEDNRGILPLPNLDFKFVCANTLIPAPETANVGELGLEYDDPFFDTFTALTEQYFYAGTPAEKQTIRERLETVVGNKVKNERNRGHDRMGGENLFRGEHLSPAKRRNLEKEKERILRDTRLWSSYKNIFSGDTVGFFDPKYMFPDAADGFDVVIANPPYVRQEEIKEFKPAFAEVYSCYKGTADLLVYFYERGCCLLKEGGVLTYITSNKYFRAGYGEKLRGYLASTMRIHQLIDFGDAPVFDATAYPSIIVMSKVDQASRLSKSKRDACSTFLALNWTPGDPVSAFVDIFKKRAFPMEQSYLTSDGWKLEQPHIFELMQKLRTAGTPLCEYVDGKFYYGIKTGFNEAFVIDRATRDRLIAEDPRCETIIKPFLRGRDIKRWRTNPQDLWLIFTRRGIDLNKYPSIKTHLEPFRERLEPKPKNWTGGKWGGRKAGSYKWYEIQDNIAYWPEFEKPKILYQEISTFHAFAWDEDGYFANNKCFLVPDASLFLFGVLNVPSSWWFIGNLVTKLNGGAFEMRAPCVAQIPIPSSTPFQQSEIEERVEKVLALKKENPEADVSELEAEIDHLVYQLYNLTDEEIRIIDPEYQPVAVAPSEETINVGRWVVAMQAYLYASGEDLVAVEEMAMAHILMTDDDLRKRVLKGGIRKASKSVERVPNVDALWEKHSNDRFNLVDTPTEKAVGLGRNAKTLDEIKGNKEARKMLEKAKEAHRAIVEINKTVATPEERFAWIGRKYEPARIV